MSLQDVQDNRQKRVPLVEMFGPTVQGEGAVIGMQTYFLRFGLCDYKCTMCDSMHAVDPKQVSANAQRLTQEEIAKQFLEYRSKLPHSTRWVTFSGGNPCIHDLEDLCATLWQEGKILISVETQGTFSPEWLTRVDSICVSPKGPGMGEKFEPEKCDAFVRRWAPTGKMYMKIVVFDQRDLEFASMLYERYVSEEGPRSPILRSGQFFLSQGNPYPPGMPIEKSQPAFHAQHLDILIKQYQSLLEDIQRDKNLCNVKFLPQMHVWLWGNKQGV